MTSEITLIHRQINTNNSNIDRLLRLIEQNQRENTLLLARLETIRTPRPAEDNPALDIMFYTFFPRNTEPVEPEPIPTHEIISSETSICIFKNIEEPTNTSCPITFENFLPDQSVMMIDHCGHLFNPRDLRQWFRCHSTCPVCRYNICSREEPSQDVPQDTLTENPETDSWGPDTRNFTSLPQNVNTSNFLGSERNLIDNFVSRITNNRVNVNDILNTNVNDILNIMREDGTGENFINRFRNI